MFGLEEQVLAERLASLTGQPWGAENTGGGCTAFMWHVSPNYAHYFMVTHSEDASIPAPNEPHHLGEYVNEDQDINHWHFANRQALVKFLKVWGATHEGGSL